MNTTLLRLRPLRVGLTALALILSCPPGQSAAPVAPAFVPLPGASFARFQEISPAQVTPQGWLREFLMRQNSGLTGHHEVLSYPFNTCLWAGLIPRQGGHGSDWWRYEQTAYLTDGIIRLGYVLQDEKLIRIGQEGINYILAHPMPNHRLGHPFFESQWPMAVFFRVLQAEYLATRDARLLEALRQHYLSYSVDDLVKGHRHIVNLEGILWTYGQTGDRRLLVLAETAYRRGGDALPMALCASPDKIEIHGVTYMEEAKLPAILYSYTGKRAYLSAAINAFRKLDRDHMLPDGVPSSNENLAGKNPLQSHETCDISDYTWSLGYLLMATGEATWADHLEKAIFNAGPGAVSKDFKNLQYFSSVNQVIATGTSNHNSGSVPGAHGTTWMAYWPCHETECCAGNVHRFMPNYAARMWMRDQNGDPVAALYGPSETTVPLEQGQGNLTIAESTGYPFADTITFRFRSPGPVVMSFTFRLPAWCEHPVVTVNGKPFAGALTPGRFIACRRTFSDGDEVVLRFPMVAKLVDCDGGGVAVERGPLLFAYAVPEAVQRDDQTYANLRGKKSSDPVNFPALEIKPAGPWNYALAVKSNEDLVVTETDGSLYPLDPGAAPVRIRVPARKVRDWVLQDNRYTPPLPRPGSFACEPETVTLTLVPYGSTRLRLSVFPRAL